MTKAGFAQANISPETFPIRTYMGSVNEIIDPIYAQAAVFSDGNTTLAFLSFNVVIVEREYADRIRQTVSVATGIPQNHIMVCATHNHACPAVVDRPTFAKDHGYIEFMLARGADAVIQAFQSIGEVEIGVASGWEARVSFNRRFIKRDGTVITQPSRDDLQDILCNEGVIDPEVGVLCARKPDGQIAGLLVNFGCHAVHLMRKISAGYPGVMGAELQKQFGPQCVTVFLNGPNGNIIHHNYLNHDQKDTKENTGRILAGTVARIVNGMKVYGSAALDAREECVAIKYRPLNELERNLAEPGGLVNVFKMLIPWYRYSLEKLRALHQAADHEMAILQVFRIGDAIFASVPAEYFAEHGLRIKRESPHRHTYVVSLANGWLGYIPTQAALTRRGGHESTMAFWSKMEPAAGDIMAEKVVAMIKQITS